MCVKSCQGLVYGCGGGEGGMVSYIFCYLSKVIKKVLRRGEIGGAGARGLIKHFGESKENVLAHPTSLSHPPPPCPPTHTHHPLIINDPYFHKAWNENV